MTSRTTIEITCDSCGQSQPIPGVVNWLTLSPAQYAIDVTPLNRERFDGADLCGWPCVVAYANARAAA